MEGQSGPQGEPGDSTATKLKGQKGESGKFGKIVSSINQSLLFKYFCFLFFLFPLSFISDLWEENLLDIRFYERLITEEKFYNVTYFQEPPCLLVELWFTLCSTEKILLHHVGLSSKTKTQLTFTSLI